MDTIWFHIDVNSAYLSWSAAENLKNGGTEDFREIPAIVGGDMSKRLGVVLAKSPSAKACGVKTGEPVTDALKKCPGLVIIPPDHKLYAAYSARLMALLAEYSPDLRQYSIDECFMRYMPEYGGAGPVADACALKDRIRRELSFTVNIGISTNKLLAKMASDFKKPDRVHTLFPEEIQKKMWPLPVGELFMVGRSTVNRLHLLGIKTIGDLAAADPKILEAHLKSHGRTIWEYANGIEGSPIDIRSKSENKGIGNSTTIAYDVTDRKAAAAILRELSEKVAGRLRKAGQLAGIVCVEIKYYDFKSASHQKQLLTPSNTSGDIYRAACQLFDELWNEEPVRLLGIRTSKLCEPGQQQLNLFDMGKNAKMQKLDEALDKIRNKYGEGAVVRGSSIRDDKGE